MISDHAARPSIAHPSAPAEPIDAVYLWVDGADPALRAALSRHRSPESADGSADAADARRFRDNGELRFSLRSLEFHAPWIRHVHVVTQGQVPDWLDLGHPRLSVWHHAAIYPDPSHLPTFNSHSIELHIHRIPGLSDRYLYLNDDVFFGRPVTLADFVTPQGGQRVLLEPWAMPDERSARRVHDRAYVHTQRLLDRRYGVQPQRRAICHAPQLYDRATVRRLLATWPDEIARTSSHRFRAPDDVALRILYFHALLEDPDSAGRHAIVADADLALLYRLVMIGAGGDGLARQFDAIARERPAFFCLNDDLDDDAGADVVRMQTAAFLYWYFRQPSTFERTNDRARSATEPARGPR